MTISIFWIFSYFSSVCMYSALLLKIYIITLPCWISGRKWERNQGSFRMDDSQPLKEGSSIVTILKYYCLHKPILQSQYVHKLLYVLTKIYLPEPKEVQEINKVIEPLLLLIDKREECPNELLCLLLWIVFLMREHIP